MNTAHSTDVKDGSVSKEVVILLTDMVQYSKLTQYMRPEELRDFIIDYYEKLQAVVDNDDFRPLSIDPSAGDGAVIIFEKRQDQGVRELCSSALQGAVRLNGAIDREQIPSTRMG